MNPHVFNEGGFSIGFVGQQNGFFGGADGEWLMPGDSSGPGAAPVPGTATEYVDHWQFVWSAFPGIQGTAP